MKDSLYKWTELVLKYWTVILPALLFIGSAVGWSFSAVDNTEKDELTEAMKDQIEVLVDYKPKPAPIGRGQECSNCEKLVKRLINEHTIKHRSEH
jgi:hypothetical protein